MFEYKIIIELRVMLRSSSKSAFQLKNSHQTEIAVNVIGFPFAQNFFSSILKKYYTHISPPTRAEEFLSLILRRTEELILDDKG